MPKSKSNSYIEKDSSKNQQNKIYDSQYPQPIDEDSIDLIEVLYTLWKKKWVIACLTLIAALGSVTYALYQPIVYKAKVKLLAPKLKDISLFTLTEYQSGIDLNQVTVFKTYKRNLSSRILQ